MNIFLLILFLVMGTTVYLLIFRRDYMMDEQRLLPKVFTGTVTMFGCYCLAFGYSVI